MKKIKIAIVDDHPSVRYGIKSLLNSEKDFDVVGEFDSALSLLQARFSEKPEILILDISLPDLSGIKVIDEIKKIISDIKILILSMHCRSDYIMQAVEKGVCGYVTKETAPENLILGIRQIINGEYYFDKRVMELVFNKIAENPVKVFDHDDGNYKKLTNREQEILKMLAQGFSSQEVAEKVFISKRTVDNYRTTILKKLELHHPIEIVYYAQKLGII
ncbi:MAG: response regulator transcription factor [Spirochaetales bacterium]|nr:response regulator transcription factor [Spirochaetales bacterium]